MKTLADRFINRYGDAWLFDGTQDRHILNALRNSCIKVEAGYTWKDTRYMFIDNSIVYFTNNELMRSK